MLKWLYAQTLKPFYVPGAEVPNMWDDVKHFFDDQRLKAINMTAHAFHCHLGLWRALNNNQNDVNFPLPPITRIVPLLFLFGTQ